MQIRPAVPADLDILWQLWKTIVDQQVYFPYDQSYSRADIEATWLRLDNPTYVAEQKGEVTGAYILRPNQPGYGDHIANAAYMVATEARSQGVGQELCAHSIETARSTGFRAMQFNLVVATNESAIRTWLANGFRIIGTVPGGFRHVEQGFVDAHIFFREL